MPCLRAGTRRRSLFQAQTKINPLLLEVGALRFARIRGHLQAAACLWALTGRCADFCIAGVPCAPFGIAISEENEWALNIGAARMPVDRRARAGAPGLAIVLARVGRATAATA